MPCAQAWKRDAGPRGEREDRAWKGLKGVEVHLITHMQDVLGELPAHLLMTKLICNQMT